MEFSDVFMRFGKITFFWLFFIIPFSTYIEYLSDLMPKPFADLSTEAPINFVNSQSCLGFLQKI